MSKGDPGMGANMTANPWGGAQAFLAQLMRPGQQHGMLNQQQMPGWQQQFGGPGMLNQMPGWQAQILPQPSPPPATSAGPALVPQPAAAAAAAPQRGQGVDPGAAAALPLEQRRLLNFDPLTNTYY